MNEETGNDNNNSPSLFGDQSSALELSSTNDLILIRKKIDAEILRRQLATSAKIVALKRSARFFSIGKKRS